MRAFRIFEVDDRTDRPQTLFHGVEGSRTLPLGRFLEADTAPVHDGTDGTKYRGGFHVTRTREEAVDYLRNFRKERPLVVCPVFVANTWPKSHARADVLLARWMMITRQMWALAENPIDNPCEVHTDFTRFAELTHTGLRVE